MTDAARRLVSYFERRADLDPKSRRSVYIVRDGLNGPIVDWSLGRSNAVNSSKSWEPHIVVAQTIREALSIVEAANAR